MLYNLKVTVTGFNHNSLSFITLLRNTNKVKKEKYA